ncbi:glycosyltransferase [Roseomonas sp. BN140053]|uniref:glycosyltransferase n=1 Tax=Roseomonas sp. BN140053 TaxID=3391898 RepID=UPI0039E89B70
MQAPPRILEIGEFCLFRRTWPDSTVFIQAGPDSAAVAPLISAYFRPRHWQRPGRFDLIVAHPPLRSPGNPEMLRRLLSPRRSADARRGIAWGLASRLPPGRGAAPLAVLDMHDEREVAPHCLPLLDHCRHYFKRELPADPAKAFRLPLRDARLPGRMEKLRPISLGLSAEVVTAAPPPLPKTVDLFFAGSTRHAPAIRAEGLRRIEALAARGVRVDIAREALPREEFLRRCGRAWLTFSPEGLGWDCFRHYEAALCRSVPVINQPTIRRHAPLREGEHALHYEVEGDGLERVVLAALADPGRLARMAEAARAQVLEHHTHEALCRYVVASCLG